MKTFNPEKLVAIGEGLAAGFGPFTLTRWSQRYSFPAMIARQYGVAFPLPLFEPPGIGNAPGFEAQPVILPGISQATVFDSIPPEEFANLSVPGMTLRGALEWRPRSPWVVQTDPVRTALNLIVGGRRLATNAKLLTQVESAMRQGPTGVIVCLGFTEALDAAIGAGESAAPHLPTAEEFGRHYTEVARILSPATLLMFTVPDPFDTPFFVQPAAAANILRVKESWLCERFGLLPDDRIKIPAVHEIGFQIFGRSLASLPPGSKVSAGVAAALSSRVAQWNSRIRKIAAGAGARVYDLADLFSRLRTDGQAVGNRHLTADYLGGLYSLNGYYPGHVGHALIANEILALECQPLIDIEEIARLDPAVGIEPAQGRPWSAEELSRLEMSPTRSKAVTERSQIAVPVADPKAPGRPLTALDKGALPPLFPNTFESLPQPLSLPPGLTQELVLDTAGSYFGDGIAATNCESPLDAQFDGAGETIFGGLALVDSHLHGSLRFEFTPIGPDRAAFTIRFDRLAGDDAVLTTPVLFRMAFQESGVSSYPAPFDLSSGEVDLITGRVSRLRVYARFGAIALNTLVATNPNFPSSPLCFLTLDAVESPLEYSSASAFFEQRPDGNLDFTFYGTRFVPLGPGARWPLNFGGPEGQFATIPASGTVMHPHLRLTTKAAGPAPPGPNPVDVPTNCVREFIFHTHNTAFGDAFDLRVPELGGPCTGRSHIMGRAAIQFGIPSGGTQPVAVRSLPPGGIFAEAYPSPIAAAFPVRLGPGPRGFDQKLRYPRATFTMEKISLPDDPFDVALGALDLATGRLSSDHLHRAFIEQDVISALLRIESRVRQTSFFFRGPGLFSTTRSKALMFRFLGNELVPYPAGLAYPQPDFTASYFATMGATLTPYFWIRAVENAPAGNFVAEGKFDLVAANRDEFCLEYRLPADTSNQDFYFRYENKTQLGLFTLHSLVWIGFGNSADGPPAASGFDTVTFSGFGVWEKNSVRSLEQVAGQIWNNPGHPLSPYIGIQVTSGDVSNVDLRPVDPNDALP
jgi:hypothetical protein